MKKTKPSKNLSSLCERLKQEIETLEKLPSEEKQKAQNSRKRLYDQLKKQLDELSE